MTHVLRIDSSMRRDGSTTRALTEKVVEALAPTTVTERDLLDGIDLIDEEWIAANFTDPAERSAEQNATLAASDTLVAEVKAADVLVIGAPIYNFSVPGALKAWIDQICRARETFRYTENGPVGLLEGKRAIIVVASGGVPVDSPVDFMTPYLRHVLGFIGITDVTVIAADRQMQDADAAQARALAGIDGLAA